MLKISRDTPPPFLCVLGFQPPIYLERYRDGGAHCGRMVPPKGGSVEKHLSEIGTSSEKAIRGPAPQWGTAISSQDIRGLRDSKKLSPRYVGPYKIIKQINPVTYRLDLPRHSRIHPAFHVSQFEPGFSGPLAEAVPPTKPPDPLDLDGEVTFTGKSTGISGQLKGGMVQRKGAG